MSQSSRVTGCERILARLERGPATAAELYAETYSIVHSRISELRRKGHVITCERTGGHNASSYVYQLRRREPNEDTSLPEATSPVFVGAFTTDAPSVAEQQLTLLGTAPGDGAPYASSESRAA